MLKILQARLQQYMNRELPDAQAGFRKGRGTRDQIANICWIMEKAREFQINIYFCFIDYAKAFDCVDHKKLWKILKEMDQLRKDESIMEECENVDRYFESKKLFKSGSISMDTFNKLIQGNGNPLHCSCLENPRDGRAWRAAIYGVAQSRTRLK